MNKRVELIVGEYPNQRSLDLEENAVSIALQYSIDDVRNIDKKNTNYSKTITLPGTKKNNLAFGSLFDINTTFDKFNPNLKTKASIVVDSSPVLEGYLQLKSVNKLNNADLQGNKISYEVVVFDDSIDFMQSIGNKLLIGNSNTDDDLNFSDKNHTYNQTNIEDAWNNNTYADVYQYPLMDKITEGYKTEDFKPAFYHKALLLKIAEDASYTLEGSFIDNENEDVNSLDYGSYHKELILWDGDTPTITDAEALQREFNAGASTASTVSLGTFSHDTINVSLNKKAINLLNYDTITPNPPYFDNTGGYTFNNSGGSLLNYSEWECTNSGKYSFALKGDFKVKYNKQDNTQEGEVFVPSSGNYTDVKVGVYVELVDLVTGEVYGNTTVSKVIGDLPSGVNSGELVFDDVINIPEKTIPLNARVAPRVSLYNEKVFYWGYTVSPRVLLIPVDIELEWDRNITSFYQNKTVQVENITDGDEIEISQYLPKAIKQKEIISDIIKRYNVYIRKHPTKDKTLILDCRDEYYKNNTTVLDWTQKKDYSSEDKISFLSDLQAKEILFTYKESNGLTASDGRKYNEEYTQSTGDIYGQKKISFNNDFVKGTKKIESIFSTTPLVFRGNINNNVVVPSVGSEEKKRKPILSYWGGLVNCKDADKVNSNFKITWGSDTSATVYTTYPYTGHWNNPYDPTIDIHYGDITYEFYGLLLNNSTDNNLFSRYWFNYYNQISTGKLITSKLYLRETDINFIKDNLSARIFIKDSYYNINKIIDYKPLEDGLTTVELLRIEQGSEFTPTTLTNPFESTSIDTNVAVSSVGPFVASPENEVSSINVMALGVRNYVGGGSSGIINGNDNVIGGNSTGINVTGNDNTVGAGVSNVTIVGNNQTVTESNTSIINGNVINSDTAGRVNGEIEIGDWNMDTTLTVSITNTLTNFRSVRDLNLIIINDFDTIYYSGPSADISVKVNPDYFILQRLNAGIFDTTEFDSTSFNRGFINFSYIPD